MQYHFRKATKDDFYEIWEIINFAKESRKKDGSKQWQDGYPNQESILSDIKNNHGYVLSNKREISLYIALISGNEPTYKDIKGKWLTKGDYCTIHRMAISPQSKGKGFAKAALKEAEELCKTMNIPSIRVDTNFDNGAMLHLLEQYQYTYCGEIEVRNQARMAFEKIL